MAGRWEGTELCSSTAGLGGETAHSPPCPGRLGALGRRRRAETGDRVCFLPVLWARRRASPRHLCQAEGVCGTQGWRG